MMQLDDYEMKKTLHVNSSILIDIFESEVDAPKLKP